MQGTCRKTFGWLVLAAAVFALTAATPLAAAAGPELHAAPLSAAFLRYQADVTLRHTFGLDRVPGPQSALVPAPMDPSAFGGVRLDAALASYPSSYDLRTYSKVSPIKDQDPYGACWTFATFGSLESCLLPGELRDFSEDNVALNAGFDTGSTPLEKYDGGGNYDMSTAYLIRWSGPVDESEDAYGDSSTPPGLSAKKHVQEVLYIPGGTSPADTANVKCALTTYGAVATSICWDDAYYAPGTAGFYYSGGSSPNHAVTIIGWDDSFAAADFTSAPPGPGAWLVRNSWGAAWGQSGYFWVSYYDRYCGTSDVLNAVFRGVEPTTNYSGIYSYDPLGQTDTVGYGSTTGWGANVFTARRSESIAAVGFFTHMPNTTYTVYAGASLQALQAKGSGTISTPGFHTVKLSSPHAVTGGTKFVVALRLTAPGNDYPLAVEYAVTDYSSSATALPGQSFISSSGSGWSDLSTTWDSTANVCLKAYSVASSPSDDTVGPRCAAKNVIVRRGRTCRLYFRVHDARSTRVTKHLVVKTRSGAVKKRWSTGYAKNYDGWWSITFRCRLRAGTYRIVVTGEDLAGNKASVVGRATLRVR